MTLRSAKPNARLLAIMEASTVTGPAKNLIDFCARAGDFETGAGGSPSISASIATFERLESKDARSNSPFVLAAREAGVETTVIGERFRFDRRVIAELHRLLESSAPDIVQTHNV